MLASYLKNLINILGKFVLIQVFIIFSVIYIRL